MKNAWMRNGMAALCALPATIIGCIAMKLHGLSTVTAFQNVAVLLVGGLVSCLYLKLGKPLKNVARYVVLAVSLCLLAAVFLFPGVEGIHRWVYVGPFALHMALIVLPIVLIGLYAWMEQDRCYEALVLCAIVSLLLFFQKDASMLTAFALAVSPLMYKSRTAKPVCWGVTFGLFVLAAISWVKHPLLAPEAHVEGIVGLAMQLSPVLGILGLAAIVLLFVPFAAGLKSSVHRPFFMGCVLFYAGWLLSCAIGAFPIPVMGYGASAVIGYLVLATVAVGKNKQ